MGNPCRPLSQSTSWSFSPIQAILCIIFLCIPTIHAFKPSNHGNLKRYSLGRFPQRLLTARIDIDPSIISQEFFSSDISNLVVKSDDKVLNESFEYSEERMDTYDRTNRVEELDVSQFGDIFRHCAPYIAMHRGSIMVIHIGSHVFNNRKLFDAIIDDISILHLLGVFIVIVAGVRAQLDEKIIKSGAQPTYHDGVRITDHQTMKFLKEVSGSARFEIESALARGYRGRPGQSGINVVSGNFFYTAKPFGVRQGVDFQMTGEVRKIEVENVKKRLEFGDVVLLTSLGYSPSGEVFNCQSESLAAECAARVGAAKIIYLTRGETMYDTKNGKTEVVQNLRLTQAVAYLESHGVTDNVSDSATIVLSTAKDDSRDKTPQDPSDRYIPDESKSLRMRKKSALEEFLVILSRCVYALNGGVRRAHLIAPTQGALLKELYTRDGAGMLISRDVYEGIRPAQPSDLRSIETIIEPLVVQGILINRTRDQLEKELPYTFLLTRDGTTLGLGMLKPFDDHAEICCLAVDPKYRRHGRGETMLAYLERRALMMGLSRLFVLSTHTMQWFEERGFILSDPSLLPPQRGYNQTRASKVYIKQINSARDIDAEEVLWNV